MEGVKAIWGREDILFDVPCDSTQILYWTSKQVKVTLSLEKLVNLMRHIPFLHAHVSKKVLFFFAVKFQESSFDR